MPAVALAVMFGLALSFALLLFFVAVGLVVVAGCKASQRSDQYQQHTENLSHRE